MTLPAIRRLIQSACLVAAPLLLAVAALAEDFDAAWHRATGHDSRFGALLHRDRIEPRWTDDGAAAPLRPLEIRLVMALMAPMVNAPRC